MNIHSRSDIDHTYETSNKDHHKLYIYGITKCNIMASIKYFLVFDYKIMNHETLYKGKLNRNNNKLVFTFSKKTKIATIDKIIQHISTNIHTLNIKYKKIIISKATRKVKYDMNNIIKRTKWLAKNTQTFIQ